MGLRDVRGDNRETLPRSRARALWRSRLRSPGLSPEVSRAPGSARFGGVAMRVNMDSSIINDPRFKLVAADMGKSWREVIGSCFLLWTACYERRSICLRLDEADVAAELPGFAEALIKRGLATRTDAETMRVHGVEARIAFLEKQSEKGKRGGQAKAKKDKTGQAYASGAAKASPEAEATGSAKAYTHALAQDQDQDQDQSLAQDQETKPTQALVPAPPNAE